MNSTKGSLNLLFIEYALSTLFSYLNLFLFHLKKKKYTLSIEQK